jgi:hypothetical protein
MNLGGLFDRLYFPNILSQPDRPHADTPSPYMQKQQIKTNYVRDYIFDDMWAEMSPRIKYNSSTYHQFYYQVYIPIRNSIEFTITTTIRLRLHA